MDLSSINLNAALLRIIAATIAGRPEPAIYYLFITKEVKTGKVGLVPNGREPLIAWTEKEVEDTLKALREGVNSEDRLFLVFGPVESPAVTGERFDVVVNKVNSYREDEHGKPMPAGDWNVGPDYDLLCWTPAAFDKFVAPYYYMLYGSNEAAHKEVQRLRKDMINGSGIMGHRWPTTMGMLDQGERFDVLDQRG